MCLCGGTGGVHVNYTWGIEFHPCPDTRCRHNMAESKKRYEDWKKRMQAEMQEESLTLGG